MLSGKQTGRKLQVVLGVLSLIIVALVVTTAFFGIQLKKKTEELKASHHICNTKDCVTAAGDMIKSLDMTASPCDDFFQFACGKWLKNNPIPDTGSSWNQFNVLRDHLNRKIREILERKIDQKDPLPLNIAKQFYNSCLAQANTTSHEELTNLINEILDDSQLNINNLGQKLGELRRIVAGNFIITTTVSLDEENTTRHKVYIDQPALGLNRIYMVQTPEHHYKTAYVELVEEVWELIYPDEMNNKSIIANEIVDFESQLAEISTKPEDRRDRNKLYNPMTIAQLANLTNSSLINWEKYIQETFKDVEEIGDPKTFTVIVRDIPFFTEVGRVIKNATEMNQDVIWNYLRWRIILNYASDVDKNLRDILFNYARKTQGTQYPPPRWQVCSDRANSLFGMAISYHYVQDVFTSNFQQQMSEMIGNIQQAFYDIIKEINWFGEPTTKLKARRKAEKIRSFLGYPEWLLDHSNDHKSLREEFKGVPENMTDDHFKNMLELINWKNVDNLKHINLPKDSSKWISDPTVVNAFYSSTYNSITFPAGILQPPFYFTGKPIQALNYGAIGMVIGHEITHGFDDRGRQSDGDGDLVDWWDEETVKQYTERANCFVQQYGSYIPDEAENMTLNGNNTLGENIADNGGLRQAFRAYKSYVEKNGPEPRLPGLEYSPEQLFFIAFSQIWCGAYSKQGMESQIKTGVHSPNKFRVKGALQNSPEFAETWGCPIPNEKSICRIW